MLDVSRLGDGARGARNQFLCDTVHSTVRTGGMEIFDRSPVSRGDPGRVVHLLEVGTPRPAQRLAACHIVR